jgi:hypothetical protein
MSSQGNGTFRWMEYDVAVVWVTEFGGEGLISAKETMGNIGDP